MTDDENEVPILAECALEPETDIGNGRRFRRRHGDLAPAGRFKAIRVAHVGWHVFDDARWKEDQEDAAVRPLAHDAAEAIGKEVYHIQANPEEQALIDGAAEAQKTLDEMGEPQKPGKGKGEDAEAGADMFAAQRAALKDLVKEGARVQSRIRARRAERFGWCEASCSRSRVDAMLSEAAPYVTRLVDDLNVNRLAVNCRSGTIHFVQRPIGGAVDASAEARRDGVAEKLKGGDRFKWLADLRPHADADMITKLAEAAWFPGADNHLMDGIAPQPGDQPDDWSREAPVFESFLEAVIPDIGVRDFLQRFFGYCLLGLTTEQVLLFFHGIGRNGKSTFMEAICRVMGDYAVTLAIESFSGDQQRGGGDATPDLARLPGARLVSASEPEQSVKLKVGMIKALTGGEKFPVRRLRKEFFEIDPQFKMVISGNHKPVVTDDSDGIWRRLLLVPWEVQVPKDQVDRALPEKLRREADGIFAWLVDGALNYLSQGLEIPESITAASKDYREESDPIEGFILAACEVTGMPDDIEKSFDLFVAYEIWCRQTGSFSYNQTLFSRRLPNKAGRPYACDDGKLRTFSKSKSNGMTVYRGIRIKPDYLPGAGKDERDEM